VPCPERAAVPLGLFIKNAILVFIVPVLIVSFCLGSEIGFLPSSTEKTLLCGSSLCFSMFGVGKKPMDSLIKRLVISECVSVVLGGRRSGITCRTSIVLVSMSDSSALI